MTAVDGPGGWREPLARAAGPIPPPAAEADRCPRQIQRAGRIR